MQTWKLDYDGKIPVDFNARCRTVARLLRVRLVACSMERTRRGWHVVVRCSGRLSPVGTVAVQAILGSDPLREAHNLMRARKLGSVPKFWRKRWNVLYCGKLSTGKKVG